MRNTGQFLLQFFCSALVIVLFSQTVFGARLKDVSSIRGVRSNQLIGYGLVVGLKGTGDGKLEFTNQSMIRMLDKLGMKLNSTEVSSKNVAAVLVTAELPAFARAGNKINITVNSIGDASSLKGGTLIQTPLRAADQQVYAVAQGSLTTAESQTHLTVAQLPGGALVERDLENDFSNKGMFRFTLNEPDFTTAARVAKSINLDLGGQYATASDATTIDLIVPEHYKGKGVELLAGLESLEIQTDTKARVVVNQKTGTVVIGDQVRVRRVALSHGDLSIKVGSPAKPADAATPEARAAAAPAQAAAAVAPAQQAAAPKAPAAKKAPEQNADAQVPPPAAVLRGPASVGGLPAPSDLGGPVAAEPAPAVSAAKLASAPSAVNEVGNKLVMLEGETSVGDLVRSLNQLGVGPQDLITILQNLKASGALQAEIEVL